MHPWQLPRVFGKNAQFCQVSLLVAWLLLTSTATAEEVGVERSAIERSVQRAVNYLSREVGSWKAEHNCYSCHHHGDGARALFAATQLKTDSMTPTIKEAAQWLGRPDDWDQNGPDGPFSDRKLARIQFASALAEATERGIVADRKPLINAAEQVAREQLPTGVWDFEGVDSLGGPITYGRTLVTVQARRVLLLADRKQHRQAIERSDDWLRKIEPRSVIDSAAVLTGLGEASDDPAEAQRQRCLDILKRGQTDEGGWGPYVTSNPEAFDTALVVLALAAQPATRVGKAQSRGVSYLIRSQLSDGSWPETTRPLPRESYSQRVSTTAWATLALLSQR